MAFRKLLKIKVLLSKGFHYLTGRFPKKWRENSVRIFGSVGLWLHGGRILRAVLREKPALLSMYYTYKRTEHFWNTLLAWAEHWADQSLEKINASFQNAWKNCQLSWLSWESCQQITFFRIKISGFLWILHQNVHFRNEFSWFYGQNPKLLNWID